MTIGIEDLCTKRDELHKQILEEEEEKRKVQNDIRILTERLAKINESLSKKMASRNEFDKTIAETEAAYMKVMHVICNFGGVSLNQQKIGTPIIVFRKFTGLVSKHWVIAQCKCSLVPKPLSSTMYTSHIYCYLSV